MKANRRFRKSVQFGLIPEILAMCKSIVWRSGVQVNVIIPENTPLDNKGKCKGDEKMMLKAGI